MRILLVHNQYQQLGGEDTIFKTEADLLESYGHEVIRYVIHNDRIKEMTALALAKATFWNHPVYQELRALIQAKRPQIAHFHNTFPLISPAAYYAAKQEGVPVVQTLHNFRLLCANGLFFRDGKVCEMCLTQKTFIPGIIHRCYRQSTTASAAAATMVKFHDLLGTWSKTVDIFIVYSHFAHQKFIEGGLPTEKIAFKTNFLYPVPELGSGTGNYALFVGRLAPEKGTKTLLSAWQKLGHKIPLKILGDGPLAPEVHAAAERIAGIEWLGRKPLSEVYELMGEATFLIISSEWYETFGRVGIEALAKGTPLVVSQIGALAELVIPKQNGLTFQPGDADDLVTQIDWLISHPKLLKQMRSNARADFEAKYSAADNYTRLREIYTLAGAQ
ncbi:glycosyl transferase group 1 [Halothece sp. PCC 7418]|uniref:glycosyltransferase n=1 Tax=Halothece sp. (strain PCC 7418) TaxID=65093 RepID=UPI0002A05C3B|nr:glycosyltransferase [Halothece sp. PCC 7418]AFZ44031.1 glycosyl transferase group 1 [Halothece sp. PCC 7418]